MTGPVVLFIGPSLPHALAREVLPDAICLPPAAMGDVLGASLTYHPRAIGVVDGTFLSNMSVFHKELLFAMEQGAWVLGASSMGALRAAECAEYGMIGVGSIYESLASGQLEDDDEVALTHAGPEEEYRPLSDALVTIRATLAAAEAGGLITSDEAEELVARQKARWFPERRLSAVVADASALGLSPERVAALRDFVRTQVVDPKREDALLLLERIRELPDSMMPLEDRPKTVISGVFMAALARDTVVEGRNGMTVTFDRMRRYAALHDTDYASDMRAARQSIVLAELSQWIGGWPDPGELDAARARLVERLGLTDDDLEAWAATVDLRPSGLHELIASDALLWRLETSWLGRSRLGEVTTPYLNHLRVTGRYTDLKSAAALQQAAAKGVELDPLPSPGVLVASLAALGPWRVPADFSAYLEEAELGTFGEFLDSVIVSIKAHHALFGIGLVDSGPAITVVEDSEPMMSRGR